MLTSLQNIVLNEGLNDNGMYDILHVFVKFLGTQRCDKNMFMHYTCFCQKFCRQFFFFFIENFKIIIKKLYNNELKII